VKALMKIEEIVNLVLKKSASGQSI